MPNYHIRVILEGNNGLFFTGSGWIRIEHIKKVDYDTTSSQNEVPWCFIRVYF